MDDDLNERGAAVMAEVIGPNSKGASTPDDPIMWKFRELTEATVFGAIWSRPGLDYRTRALICVISDISTGRYPELVFHTRMALRQGWTHEELTEVVVQLSGYVGAPLARGGLLTLRDVFAEEPE